MIYNFSYILLLLLNIIIKFSTAPRPRNCPDDLYVATHSKEYEFQQKYFYNNSLIHYEYNPYPLSDHWIKKAFAYGLPLAKDISQSIGDVPQLIAVVTGMERDSFFILYGFEVYFWGIIGPNPVSDVCCFVVEKDDFNVTNLLGADCRMP